MQSGGSIRAASGFLQKEAVVFINTCIGIAACRQLGEQRKRLIGLSGLAEHSRQVELDPCRVRAAGGGMVKNVLVLGRRRSILVGLAQGVSQVVAGVEVCWVKLHRCLQLRHGVRRVTLRQIQVAKQIMHSRIVLVFWQLFYRLQLGHRRGDLRRVGRARGGVEVIHRLVVLVAGRNVCGCTGSRLRLSRGPV